MSEIVKNAPYINLSKGQKYGIKVDGHKLTLPIALKNEGEVKELEEQVKSLFGKTYTGTDCIVFDPKMGFWSNTDEQVVISAGNSIAFSSSYRNGLHGSKKVNIGADTMLKPCVDNAKTIEKDENMYKKPINPSTHTLDINSNFR